MKLALAALLALVAAAPAAVGASDELVATTAPAWSPDGRTLAYAVDTPGRSDIYAKTLATGATVDVTRDQPRAGNDLPGWSRDGRRLAYATAVGDFQEPRFLYVVVNADGSGTHEIGSSGAIGRPCFAASGKRVAFDDFESVDTAAALGGNQITVSAPSGGPVCSPLADRVALTQNVRDNLDVYTVSFTAKARRKRITTAKGSDAPVAWSRDGKHILFETQREIVGRRPSPKRDVALYLMDADGKHQHRVVYGRFGDLAPDGRQLVYVSPKGAVVVAGLDGRHAHVLAAQGENPKWSPSGRWIAFVSRVREPAQGGPVLAQIELVHPDGSGLHALNPF